MVTPQLDHFTIRTAQPEATVAFYTAIVGLAEGWRPGFRFPGHWLYAGERPVVHVVALRTDNADLSQYLGQRGSGGSGGSPTVDHLAFRCAGLAAYQDRLAAHGIAFRERIVPDLGEHQIFADDPNGITVEMIFPQSADNRIRGEAMRALEIAPAAES